jgi:putative aminopeptidase FrvX
MDETERMLKELTEANGVPGYEIEIRNVIKRYFEPLGTITQDKIGSLICQMSGEKEKPRVLLAGHMDEIGFMVKHITKEGFIKFTPLGGWWDQVLIAQRVVIKTHKGDVIGVIGSKPPHLMSADDKKKLVEKKDMYIDIGATSQEQVEQTGVRVGDPIIPISEFRAMATPGTYLAKALDDRLGCALMIAAMQKLKNKGHPNTIFGVATVQEEVGPRGAVTSAEVVNPDVAIITEVDIAGDTPDVKPEESSVKLGAGPVLCVYDARMIPNLRLRDLVIATAREQNIPLQLSALEGGATDGGPIHLHKTGVPTVVLGIPTRYIHSHNAIFLRHDFERSVELLAAVLRKLDEATVEGFTFW